MFACEPEWGSLLQELAADKVDVSVGTTALQDVHQIDAKPSLIAKVRKADLLVCTGAELEVGWLPQLIQQAGNQKVAATGNGYFMAASQVTTLEKPDACWTGPPATCTRTAIPTSRWILTACSRWQRHSRLAWRCWMRPMRRPTSSVLADFTTRWQAATKRWEAEGRAAQGKEDSRAPRRLGVPGQVAGTGGDRRAGTQARCATDQRAPFQPDRHDKGRRAPTPSSARRTRTRNRRSGCAERTGVPVVVLPFTVGGDAQSGDLFGFFDSTIDKLLGAAQMTLEGLDISILGPAMVAGVIVLSTHVPLGRQVLSRGIIFIDLAIAQIAALGVIAAQYHGR